LTTFLLLNEDDDDDDAERHTTMHRQGGAPTGMYRSPISKFAFYQSINQSIDLYRAIVQRRVLQCGYAESKRNVLRRILNVLKDGAVRQFSGREFQSLGAATEKR